MSKVHVDEISSVIKERIDNFEIDVDENRDIKKSKLVSILNEINKTAFGLDKLSENDNILFGVMLSVFMEDLDNVSMSFHEDLFLKETYARPPEDFFLSLSDCLNNADSSTSTRYRVFRGLVRGNHVYDDQTVLNVLQSMRQLSIEESLRDSSRHPSKQTMGSFLSGVCALTNTDLSDYLSPELLHGKWRKHKYVRRRDLQSEEEKNAKILKAEQKRLRKMKGK